VSQSGDEIRRGMIIETRIFNENHHIRLLKTYLSHRSPKFGVKSEIALSSGYE
jgi:hypothetical protein